MNPNHKGKAHVSRSPAASSKPSRKMSGFDGMGYPTQGDVIRFLYKAAGVLPEKRDPTPAHDDRQRRNLQKTLERLAAEEGNLDENFGEAIRQLAFLVAGHIGSKSLNLAVGEVVFDLMEVYRQVFSEEGTYLSKRETLRWLIADRWAPAAAVSIARQITKFGLRPLATYLPDSPNWFLPDLGGDKPTWPLAKVMHWIYTQANLSQTQFHYPQCNTCVNDDGRERDLENAQNWIRGRHLPSAAALRWTFDRAFEADRLGAPNGSGILSPLMPLHQDGARVALFLARCATHVASEVRAHFGEDFLKSICQMFEHTLALALKDTGRVESQIDNLARESNVSTQDIRLREYAVNCWNEELKTRMRRAGAELQALLESGPLSADEIERLTHTYGALVVLPTVEWLKAPSHHEVPSGFAEALLDGQRLSADRELTHDRIDIYASHIQTLGMAPLLPWMVPWLHFLVCYRDEDDAHAWIWISRAYKAARYRAGSRQYEIVNHYIELAAKMNKQRAFGKGVQWARYIGMPVRWLRDNEPTRENLAYAMEAMKRARYPV